MLAALPIVLAVLFGAWFLSSVVSFLRQGEVDEEGRSVSMPFRSGVLFALAVGVLGLALVILAIGEAARRADAKGLFAETAQRAESIVLGLVGPVLGFFSSIIEPIGRLLLLVK